jgi:hypothetical protein
VGCVNTERLLALCEKLISADGRFRIPTILQQLVNDAQNMVGNPGQPQVQNTYAIRLTELRKAWVSLTASFEPRESELVAEIGGEEFFLANLPSQIEAIARENPHTPTVTQQFIAQYLGRRNSYMTNLTQLRDNLRQIGVELEPLVPGSAEIGLLVPRNLFHNVFDELIKELATLNRVIRAFSEVATGSAERVEVHQISTSDPTFFLGLSVETAQLIGGTITWAIATWASVEGIRKLRSETQKNKSFTEDEIKQFFESKIESTLKTAVEDRVTTIMGSSGEKAGRAKEQRTDLAWALESVLTRVERGMTMELRFLPPKVEKDAEGRDIPEAEVYQQLREIVPQLKFPASEPSPVLGLPPPEPPSETKRSKSST